ncbi:MAG: ornithine carbamoyltransferase [Chloroflexaceae bacterium]|nr:ornithine carbamoyltransferase [Chloroflexaceae bacterium]
MKKLTGRDFLRITDFSPTEIREVLELAAELKEGRKTLRTQQVLGLLFYKASTRTRVSFSVAMYQLGGQVIDLNPQVTQVGRGEPIADTARVLDRYLDILAVRTFAQQDLETFAHYGNIPVINALTDLEHPCQILADLLTIQECFGALAGVTLAFLGDGNNVAHSLLLGGALLGMNVRLATPAAYGPDPAIVAEAQQLAAPGTEILITDDPRAAVQDAQVIYTDVWASMGQESEANDRLPIFQRFQVNEALFAQADPQGIFLHCLPAHREEEVTAEIMEGPRSRVWDQAENRMHAQKALMASLLGL